MQMTVLFGVIAECIAFGVATASTEFRRSRSVTVRNAATAVGVVFLAGGIFVASALTNRIHLWAWLAPVIVVVVGGIVVVVIRHVRRRASEAGPPGQ